MRGAAVLTVLATTVGACASDGDDGSTAGSEAPVAMALATTVVPDGTIAERPGGGGPRLTQVGEIPQPPVIDIQTAPSKLGEKIIDLDNPIDVVVRPGDARLFVVERTGAVRVIAEGSGASTVLDLADSVEAELEWGLLGMTFSADGMHAYLNETDGFETRIHEFAVAPDGTFDVDSQRIVYRFDQPAAEHNGGDLLIGPDGYLYIFNGDGGGDRNDEEIGGAWNSDIHRQALALDSPLGKILRLDPTPSGNDAFTVPSDNPYVGVEGALEEIWAIGVRNPWRNSFDPLTGDLWVADVGNFEREEINRVVAGDSGSNAGRGSSFGWSAWEGFGRANDDQPANGHLVPTYEYRHGALGCSVVGGPVYRGDTFADLDGKYLFGDYCTGMIWAMALDDSGAPESISTIATLPFLVDIEATEDGAIIATSIVDGVHQLVP